LPGQFGPDLPGQFEPDFTTVSKINFQYFLSSTTSASAPTKSLSKTQNTALSPTTRTEAAQFLLR
ncbi:MAG TPA: hypothetical protein PLU49_14195, partial [Saprospiraceae bacterium]|nr:hypothetical protein [Saprospiraceae bacterium]